MVDAAAWLSDLSAIEEFIGQVHVSYDPNFFQVRPSRAFSICTIHDLSFRDKRFGRLMALQEKAAWRAGRADAITTVSRASKRIILENMPAVRDEQVTVVYGAAGEEFDPESASVRFPEVARKHKLVGPYFLHVGEPSARKNIPLLIRSFQRAREVVPGLALVFAGCRRGDLREHAGNERLDLTNVIALGFVRQDELAALYYGARALLSASHEEGFGLPTVEALRTGQIVVLSDIAAANEVAGKVGLFFDPDRPDEMAHVLRRVLEMSAAERTKHIEAGLAVSRQYSWSRSAEQMLNLFQEGFRSDPPSERTERASRGDSDWEPRLVD
jgi:glycosyltransferase involved in cell wall biosynthesis